MKLKHLKKLEKKVYKINLISAHFILFKKDVFSKLFYLIPIKKDNFFTQTKFLAATFLFKNQCLYVTL